MLPHAEARGGSCVLPYIARAGANSRYRYSNYSVELQRLRNRGAPHRHQEVFHAYQDKRTTTSVTS